MKRMIMVAVALFMSVAAFAQNPATAGNDSIECRRNIMFFKTHAKSQNYVDAYEFWKKAYSLCPGETKDIYIVGAKILNWMIDNAKTPEEKETYFNELMGMYDSRIKYFGNDPGTGTDYILAAKADDYMRVKGNKTDFNLLYSWLKPAVDEKKGATDPLALSLFAYSSMQRMMRDPNLKSQYISDYMAVAGYLDEGLKAARDAENEDVASFYIQCKNGTDTNFAASGAASCETVAEVFGPKLDENKENKEYLEMIITMLRRLRCDDSPVYFKAAEYLYAITPTAEGAIGIARQAIMQKQFDRASKFYEEALKLSTDAEVKGEAHYAMATIAYEQRQYNKARQHCLKAMEERPNFGKPMILIASMYAATASSVYPNDAIMQQIVYCLVVDKCVRAKAIDPSIADDANKLINTYSRHFPRKEDVFLHPDLSEGQSFTVGGWIGETTTIRVTN